jgi:DNA-3-methyladenine glycosylase I
MGDLVRGDDGRNRCGWAAAATDYMAYHDDEWGRPVHDDVALFERIALEAFQSGLSWLTILRKRENFREAFAGFDPARIAAFDTDDVARLMGDAGIVRNRRKIQATIVNARAAHRLLVVDGSGALDRLLWSFAPRRRAESDRPARLADVPTQTAESVALSKALKERGFAFVGPTTMYAAMQACGIVDDHLAGCDRAARVIDG